MGICHEEAHVVPVEPALEPVWRQEWNAMVAQRQGEPGLGPVKGQWEVYCPTMAPLLLQEGDSTIAGYGDPGR